MALSRVSDRDIVECLQNCPEIDAPLFDMNILDELCLSDDLWANLEFPDNTNNEGTENKPVQQDKQICEDVTGLVTPPYSPPTPSQPSLLSRPPSTESCISSSSSSSSIPPSETSSPAPAYGDSASLLNAHHQLSSLLVPKQPSISPSPLPPPPSQPSSSSSVSALLSPLLNGIPQDLAKLYSQITLPDFKGSLQVLKSGEIVHLQNVLPVQDSTVQPPPLLHSSTRKDEILPPSSHIKSDPPLVVGQKRQRPEPTVDVSKLSKKQQRMIKNRESASISRQKKRQYMDSLEGRLKEAALKNSTLLQENSSLRKQINHLEKENVLLRSSFSQPSSPSNMSVLKKPALVMMVVLCFTLSITFFPRGPSPHDSSIIYHSPITALTRVKSRALLSVDTGPSPSTTEDRIPVGGVSSRNALVPVYSELSTELKRYIESRMRRWKGLVVGGKEGEKSLVEEMSSSSSKRVCSCPVGRNDTRELNHTNISLMNKDMTSCFRMSSPMEYTQGHATQNSLTILSSDYPKDTPNYLVNGPERLYQDFKKYIPRDIENYYLLSFKDHILLHPPQQNSTHYPFLSVFVPADPDYTSLLQMDCEVVTTKIIRHI